MDGTSRSGLDDGVDQLGARTARERCPCSTRSRSARAWEGQARRVEAGFREQEGPEQGSSRSGASGGLASSAARSRSATTSRSERDASRSCWESRIT